jgi:hypothetical protein
MRIRKLVGSMVLVGAMALVAAPSASALVISFDQIENGGTLVNSGGGFIGTDIIFEWAELGGVFAYCGIVDPDTGETDTNCLLDFNTNTGALTLTAEAGLFDEDGNPIAGTFAGQTIVTGTGFTDVNISGSGVTFTAEGTDTKLEALLVYFGLDTTSNWVFSNTEIRMTATGEVVEADLSNSDVPFDAPEPGLLALFGLGLLGVGRKVAKRRS